MNTGKVEKITGLDETSGSAAPKKCPLHRDAARSAARTHRHRHVIARTAKLRARLHLLDRQARGEQRRLRTDAHATRHNAAIRHRQRARTLQRQPNSVLHATYPYVAGCGSLARAMVAVTSPGLMTIWGRHHSGGTGAGCDAVSACDTHLCRQTHKQTDKDITSG